jgi:DNA-binding NarL/FixJ family response regulator
MIGIVVVDDHPLVRTGIRALLASEKDIEVLDEGDNAEDAVALARRLQPDVILLDLLLPGASGVEVIPRIAEASPATKVIVCTAMTSAGSIRRALSAGAAGYVAKRAPDGELVEAIHRVTRGDRYVDPSLGANLVAPLDAGLPESISDRERDVLQLLALGYTNHEIAKMLYISVRTVDTHRANIMRKLDLHSRAELVMFALANGLIGPA